MVSRSDDKVDFDKLEKELNAAVEADTRYWKENDAKLRAVHQKVATYDEFRDIVLAAHLKPLEKTDKIGQQSFKQPWNALSGNKGLDQNNTSQDPNQVPPATKMPVNGYEFARLWKNHYKTTQQRYAFLLHVGAEKLRSIFHNEISYGLLGEIIVALFTEYRKQDCNELLAILVGLSQVNRFRLSLDFLDRSERTACVQLLKKLHETVESDDESLHNSMLQITEVYGSVQ